MDDANGVLQIPPAEAQPGMVLVRDIVNGLGQTILKKGLRLTEATIPRLQRFDGLETIWVRTPEAILDLEKQWAERHDRGFRWRFGGSTSNVYTRRLEDLLRSAHRREFLREHGIEREPEVPPEAESARTFRERILGKIESNENLPSIPIILERLDEVMADPNADSAKIAGLLSLDPSLVARILRVVNSAFYGLPNHVEKIEQAVSMLGFQAVRNLALTASVFTMFSRERGDRFDPARFWEHSLSTGIAARLLAESLRDRSGARIDPEDAFLAGLLHDVGKILLAQHFPAAYEKIMIKAEVRHVSVHEAEIAVLGVAHTDVGHRLFERWKIRDEIATAALHHHEPGSAGLFAYIVHMADQISHGIGLHADLDEMPRLDPRVWIALDLPDSVIESTAARVLRDLEEARSVLED